MSRKRCPTCKGRGTVDWIPPHGGVWGISPWPQEACQNCNGSGWAGTPDALVEDIKELEEP